MVFCLLLQVLILTWPSCGWLFNFRQGGKLLVLSDCFLTAGSLLHLLFLILVGIVNFHHVVSKCFLFIPESSDSKVWIQQQKQSSCLSDSSHDILTHMLNHKCCILKIQVLSNVVIYNLGN